MEEGWGPSLEGFTSQQDLTAADMDPHSHRSKRNLCAALNSQDSQFPQAAVVTPRWHFKQQRFSQDSSSCLSRLSHRGCSCSKASQGGQTQLYSQIKSPAISTCCWQQSGPLWSVGGHRGATTPPVQLGPGIIIIQVCQAPAQAHISMWWLCTGRLVVSM